MSYISCGEAWQNDLAEAVQEHTTARMLHVLTLELEGLAETRAQALKHRAVQLIEAALDDESCALLRFAAALSESGDELGEELAVFLLPAHFAASPGEAAGQLKKLACSEHAVVRQWAADACGAVLSKHFASFCPTLEQWQNDESPFVRRAVVIAVKYASNIKNPAWGRHLLNLLEPLMRDKDSIIKQEIGTRTLGEGLLRNYTPEIAARLQQWTRSDDPTVRWHTAKMCCAPEAALHINMLGPYLQILLTDPSGPVQKAAIRALREWSKRVQDPSPLFRLGAIL